MTYFHPVSLVTLAHDAGWSGGDVVTAVAVAVAASGGNSGRTGGLWGVPGFPPNMDPKLDAAAAYATQKSKGWGAFPKYKSNAYLLWMPAATAAVAAAGGAAVVTNPGEVLGAVVDATGADDLLGTLKTATAPLLKAGAWLGNQANWLRVAYVVFGGAIIVGSLVMIAGPGAVGSVAGGVVKPLLKKVGK
jgi:hypothetical protein